MDYKEGDEIEIVSNPGYFWDRIKPGMKGLVNRVRSNGSLNIEVFVNGTIVGVFRHVGSSKLELIRKVKKETRKSGFAKFISSLERRETQSVEQRVDSLGT